MVTFDIGLTVNKVPPGEGKWDGGEGRRRERTGRGRGEEEEDLSCYAVSNHRNIVQYRQFLLTVWVQSSSTQLNKILTHHNGKENLLHLQ